MNSRRSFTDDDSERLATARVNPGKAHLFQFLVRMATIPIPSSHGAYRVYCSRGALARVESVVKGLGDSTGTFVLSSPNVWRHWERALAKRIRGVRANRTFLFDDSESAKNLATVEL